MKAVVSGGLARTIFKSETMTGNVVDVGVAEMKVARAEHGVRLAVAVQLDVAQDLAVELLMIRQVFVGELPRSACEIEAIRSYRGSFGDGAELDLAIARDRAAEQLARSRGGCGHRRIANRPDRHYRCRTTAAR